MQGGLSECRVVIGNASDLELTGMVSTLSGNANSIRFKVSGMFSDLAGFLNGIQEYRPHVAILDDRLDPEQTPIHMLRQARAQAEQVEVKVRWMIIGSSYNGQLISTLLAEGLDAFLFRGDALSALLIPGIQEIMRGRPFLTPRANSDYAEMLRGGRPTSQPVYDEINQEQREVARLLINDHTVADIMRVTGMEQEKVYRLRRELRERFNVKTNEGLIAALFRAGIADQIAFQ